MATHNILASVPNNDARVMHPLPWRMFHDDIIIHLESASRKHIMTFWGADTRHPQNYTMPTRTQMELHAKYTEHAVNHFPKALATLEQLYTMDDMPKAALKLIEDLMEKSFYERIPPMVGKR